MAVLKWCKNDIFYEKSAISPQRGRKLPKCLNKSCSGGSIYGGQPRFQTLIRENNFFDVEESMKFDKNEILALDRN